MGTTRAPNLRSSIYRSDTDGLWHGWVTVGIKDDGSPDRRHRMGSTEAKVTRKVRALERKRDSGAAGKAGRQPTVADWFETWLTTIAPRTVKQHTLDSTYEPKVRRWIVPQIGQHRLDRLQPEHLDAFYTWLATQGLAPNTIVQIHRIVSRALKVAWKRGKVAINVAGLVDAPIGEETDIEPFTQAEARRLLSSAATRRNAARWSVAFAVGVRQCEALGLRWPYIDLDAGTIEVGWQLKRAATATAAPTRQRARLAAIACPARNAAPSTSTTATARPAAPSAATPARRSSDRARLAVSLTAANAPSEPAGAGTSPVARASSPAEARPSSRWPCQPRW